MAVKLVSQTQRYIGLSLATKPRFSNDAEEKPLGEGSTFLEADTGDMYRWNGTQWMKAETDDTTNDLLRAILLEAQLANKMHEFECATR